MILNEKALVAAMKKATKAGGYTVMVDEEATVRIFTNRWYATLAKLPRKVAALLVEHLGYLPQRGGTSFDYCQG